MTPDIMNKLSASFRFEEVETKVQVNSKDSAGNPIGMVVFYLDSRAIQKRLDEVLGHFNWKNQYLTWQNNAQLCGIAIFNDERKEWIPKFDGAECSDIEPIKGGLSDSFKRAACMWGIGRYLYEMDGVWVELEQRGKGHRIKDNQQNKLRAAYNDFIKRVFGTGANQQPPQQPPVQPAAQNTNANPTPQQPAAQKPNNAQKPQDNVIPIDGFKIRSIKPSGGTSQLLELCDGNGEITSAYIRTGGQGIAIGALLRNVQITTKSGSQGKYNLIDSYDLAA